MRIGRSYPIFVLASFFLATATIVVRYTANIDTLLITAIVVLFASIFFLAVSLGKGGLRGLKSDRGGVLILFGLSMAATWGFTYSAILSTTIANAMFLIYTSPVFVVLLSPIILKERIERVTVVSLILAIIGVIFIFDPSGLLNFSELTIGLLFGLLAGISYAFNKIFARMLRDDYEPYALSFWGHSIAFVFFIPIILIFSNFTHLTLTNISVLFFMGMFSGTGFMLLYWGLKKVIAQKASILMLLDPVFAIMLGYVLFSEVPGFMSLAGGILILLSCVILKSGDSI